MTIDTALDVMLYAALSVMAVAFLLILLIGGWAIRRLNEHYDQAERERQV